MPESWADAAVVEVILPVCPHCLSPAYIPVKGWRDADGGRTSRRVCEKCSARYVVLTLPPESGVFEFADS
jgi:transposase-like protein